MKTAFSGVAPSGTIHLGNYLGAIKNWVELQKTHSCIFCVVDLHAITVPQKPAKLRQKILEVAAIYLAAGIDPEKSIVFIQSHNSDHTELAWILNNVSRMSDLFKMTQFKDKSQLNLENIKKEIEKIPLYSGDNYVISTKITNLIKEFINSKASVGLFDYPILMAADILLYNTDIVPVGKDQEQHVELAQTLAKRFNQNYGNTFVIPEAKIKKQGDRIMGLDDPAKKMSKSANSPFNFIALTDAPDIIRDKIKKAVTDSGNEIKFNLETKPAISNLLTIYSLVSDKKVEELENKYKDHTSYAEFKKDLGEAIITFLSPFQAKYNKLMVKPEYLKEILEKGAQKARKISKKVLIKVKNQMGIL